MLKISIPTPCHEDWDKMTPDHTGRFCGSCAKSVVDFTNMSDDEVKNFFLNKKQDEKICGRFKQTQLHRIVIELPQNILSIQMPLWKKFLAACLIVFSTTLFSCETKIKGAVNGDVKMEEGIRYDDNGYVGGLMITYDSIDAPASCNATVGFSVPEFIMDTSVVELKGDIDIIEVDTPVTTIVTDTVGNEILKPLKDTVYEKLAGEVMIKNDSVKPVKTKNPPAADSNDCKTIKNYH